MAGADVRLLSAPAGREVPPGLVVRLAWMVAGVPLLAVGIVLTIRAELGLSPWNVLADGLSEQTPLSFGASVIVIGLLVLGVGVALGSRPGVATLANMVLVGGFIDLLLASGFAEGAAGAALPVRVLTVLGGTAVIGTGTALYVGAGLGNGPRDGLMVAVAARLGTRVTWPRTAIEGGALLAGVVLGGSVGVGTLLSVVAIGPAVGLAFRLVSLDPKHVTRARRVRA